MSASFRRRLAALEAGGTASEEQRKRWRRMLPMPPLLPTTDEWEALVAAEQGRGSVSALGPAGRASLVWNLAHYGRTDPPPADGMGWGTPREVPDFSTDALAEWRRHHEDETPAAELSPAARRIHDWIQAAPQ